MNKITYPIALNTLVTKYRQVVLCQVVYGNPIPQSDRWLDEKYGKKRPPDIGYSMTAWAYSPDGKQCVAILQSENQQLLSSMIYDYKLRVLTNEEADELTQGWQKNNPKKCGEIALTTTYRKRIDSETVEEVVECCLGCYNNPDGSRSRVVTLRKEPEEANIVRKEPEKKVKDVTIEETGTSTFLTVHHTDGTKYSAILRDIDEKIDFGDALIQTTKTMLDKWSTKRADIAQGYLEQKINDYLFLYDAVALAKYVTDLGQTAWNLLVIGDSTELMHNRVIAELMQEYQSSGCNVTSRPDNFLGMKRHDFNVQNMRCEVKTIQTFGEFEPYVMGGQRLKSDYQRRLLDAINEHLENAQEQVGKNGMIILSLWSYRLAGILHAYFENRGMLSLFPPPPLPNTTLLCIPSNDVFRNYFVSFRTDYVKNIFEGIFTEIETKGIHVLTFSTIRDGLVIQASTGTTAGSVAGFSFPIGTLREYF